MSSAPPVGFFQPADVAKMTCPLRLGSQYTTLDAETAVENTRCIGTVCMHYRVVSNGVNAGLVYCGGGGIPT